MRIDLKTKWREITVLEYRGNIVNHNQVKEKKGHTVCNCITNSDILFNLPKDSSFKSRLCFIG